VRAHFRTAIQDEAGDLLPNSVISLYVNGSNGGTLLGVPIYSDGVSSSLLPNPFSTSDGNVSFYLDTPQRIDMGVLPQGGQPVYYPDVDVNIAQTSSASLNFPGTGANSTQLGLSAAAGGAQAVALGNGAAAGGNQGLAVGQSATASNTGASAIGQGAAASGAQATAEGQGASATATGATALGQNANAIAATGTAIGQGATVGTAAIHSTAVGAGANVQGPNLVVLGTAADDVFVPGGLVHSQPLAPQTLTNGSTITYTASQQVTVTCASNVTGIIIAPVAGGSGGQTVTVVNESANTITFALAGTSNVADGTSDIIAALTARTFVWDVHTSLWYRIA
jgi:hypothetical protein